MTATDEFAPEFDPITDMLDREDAAQMSEQAKPVCVSCKLPIEREQRHAGHAGSGLFSHWNDAQCITALRAALDQERADNLKLRAFASGMDWGMRGSYGQVLKSRQWIRLKMIRHGLMEDDGRRTALLSGRGEGGG